MRWTKSLKTPTPEIIERALARLAKPGANAYFFDKLHNPAWVKPLYERGYFKRPPPADRSRNDGSLSFPDWPELRFLERMAAVAPDIVGDITVSVPDTDNSRVRELQVKIGRHLNLEHSRRLATRAIGWLDDAITLRHFGEPFAHFIVHLVQLGDIKRAIRLARKLFASEEHDDYRARVHLDEWHYGRYLNMCLNVMRERAGIETLALLRDLLLDATREPHSEQSDDYSYIWRRDLTQANYTVKQIPDILIDALRDTALELSRRPGLAAQVVRETLLARKRLILMRLAIFVAAQGADPNDPFVLETLVDMSFLDRMTCRAEYTLLLQALFPILSEPAREQVMTAMAADPLQTIAPARQLELGPEQRAQLSRVVIRNRLSAFGQALPTELSPLRDRLVAELGAMQTVSASSDWHGPMSPITAEELGAMSIPELVAYLANWSPTRQFGTPSREGLARDLQQLAKNRAEDWARNSRVFVGLDPTYVRGIFLGLNDACVTKAPLQWLPLLKLAQWVLEQPREPARDHDTFDEGEDPDWSAARQALARLLTTALTTPEAGLDWDARELVGTLLQALLEDPDPPVDQSPGDDKDPLSTSINSVRGVSAHALFRFAWWVHNHLPPAADGATLTFERMPEIQAGVNRVLHDPSPAVHSVLGDWFRTIYYFDAGWTRANINIIFPESAERAPFWAAAWRAFADYDQPYDPAFPLLKAKYEFALSKLRGAPEDEREEMAETGLGQHLASYYWRGTGGEETRTLLLSYFDLCTPAAAAHVLWSLGAGLDGTESIAPEILSALTRLWSDLRSQSVAWEELKRREMYRQFGRWFMSGRFDERWALQELRHAVNIGAGIIDVEGVLARLSKLCRDYPAEVADVLEPLLKDERQLWQPTLWQAQLETALRALLESSNATARSRAEEMANQLVQGGSLFARDLVPSG